MPSNTIIKLQTSDNVEISVERSIAERSVVISDLLKDIEEDSSTLEDAIPLPQVKAAVLHKVLEWCRHHRDDDPLPTPSAEDNPNRTQYLSLSEWDVEFLKVEQEELFEIILAANYLDIKLLLDMGCRVVANMIKGKSPDEIRDTFGIENDLTPEEEEQILRENEWAENPEERAERLQ